MCVVLVFVAALVSAWCVFWQVLVSSDSAFLGLILPWLWWY